MEGEPVMNIQITSRHFKVHDTIRNHAITEVENLERFFDGILAADVVLYFEKAQNSSKHCEITLKVQGSKLFAAEHSDDFLKSIDGAVAKMERQLKKYKEKLRLKDKKTVREAKIKAE
jgi:putative sigma-54 modulation protein